MKNRFLLIMILSMFFTFGALVSFATDLVIESKNQSYAEDESKIKFEGDVKVTLDDLHIVGEKAY